METTAASPIESAPIVEADDPAQTWRPPDFVLIAIFAVLSVWLTFRHLSRIGTAIPGTPGDSLLLLWVVTHVQGSVLHGWHALWDAPIFFPAHDTLAYSESMFAVALVEWPLRLLFGPVVAYNLVHIGASVVAAHATYRLALRYTRTWEAAFVGGLVYAFAVARVTDLAHFQIVVGGALVPVVLLALLRCIDAPSIRRAVLVGLAFAAVVTTASYDGAVAAVLVVVVAAGWALTQRPQVWRPYARAAAVASGVVAVLVGPFAYEYLGLQRDSAFQRKFLPTMALRLRDLIGVPARGLTAHLPIIGAHFLSNGHPNFPGLVGLAGAVLGAIVVLRRPSDERGRRRRRELMLASLGGAILIVLAFGDWQIVAGYRITLPYSLARDALPSLSELRALTRFALGAQLAVALLAAVGVDALLRHGSRFWRTVGTIALAAIVCGDAITGIELTTVPTARDDYGIDRVLRAHPTGVVLELPMQTADRGSGRWAFVEAPRQLEALRDHDPRVNGYSGFEPPSIEHLATSLDLFPAPIALAAARRVGVRYVVVRTKLVGGAPGSVRYVLRDGSGNYTDAAARQIVQELPPSAARVVAHVAGGYVIELTQ
jgi:hypothetical protein